MDKKLKYTLLAAAAMMLVLITIAVMGMRLPEDTNDFTPAQWVLFAACCGIVLVGLTAETIALVRLLKKRAPETPEEEKSEAELKKEKTAKKQRLILAVSALVLTAVMFALMAVFFPRIKQDNVNAFTAAERASFIAFCVLEAAVLAAVFFCVVRFALLDSDKKKMTPDRQEKVLARRGTVTVLLAAAAAALTYFAGLFSSKALSFLPRGWFVALLAVPAASVLIVSVSNVLRQLSFVNMIKKLRIEDGQKLFLEQREKAEEAAKESELKLAANRQDAAVSAVMTCLSGLLIAFSSGVLRLPTAAVIPLLLAAVFMLAAGFSRVRLRVPTAFIEDSGTEAKRSDFPRLHSLAGDAAKTVGAEGEIRILLLPGGDIGVSDLDGVISLMLGMEMVSSLSEDELRAVLMHEFSHVRSGKGNKALEYANWQSTGRSKYPLSGLANTLFFGMADLEGAFETEKYRYGRSVVEEANADLAMEKAAGKKTAASALIKTYFYSLFLWEQGTYDSEPLLESETVPEDAVTRRIEEFRARTELMREKWLSLIPPEILARNASHPTMKMRLDALGVKEYEVLPGDEGSEEYLEERSRAIGAANAYSKKMNEADYARNRKENYLAPLETVKEWEAKGRPVAAEEYRTVVQALRSLGRNTEAEQLCERAIGELPPAAAAFGYFMKGSALVHRCDPAGIELLYRAVELNDNYVDEGLDFIGSLCCMLGDEEGLEKYRRIRLELAQKQIDYTNQIGYIARGDRLETEHLPEEEQAKILAYIRSVEEGSVDSIYIVRKVVTEEVFASAVVIRFNKGCAAEVKHRVMGKVFDYLDTVSDWQYSLFDYDDVPGSKVAAVPGSLVYKKRYDENGNKI